MCGVVAVFWLEWRDTRIPQTLTDVLYGSTNRGQKGYGIAVVSEGGIMRHVSEELSWVEEVLKKYKWRTSLIIGHARYTTSGPEGWEEALQPFAVKTGELEHAGLSFAFNGNIVNAQIIADELIKKGYTLKHNPLLDTEVLKFMIEDQVHNGKTDLKEILEYIHNKIDGCCNIILVNKEGDMAVAKDKWGFRPLVYGIKDGMLIVASESAALSRAGCHTFDHISSGQILQIKSGDISSKKAAMKIDTPVPRSRCIFEMIYFAHPQTVLGKEASAAYRYRFGQTLAEYDLDRFSRSNTVVVDIPESSQDSATGYSNRLGIQRVRAITKNPEQSKSGRTFIASHNAREEKIRQAYVFNPLLKDYFKGKVVVLMDDSLVRGSTLEYMIKAFQEFYEPAEIHIRIPSPPIVAPCFYGIDMATIDTLMAPKFFQDIQNPTEEELRKLAQALGVKSLKYLTRPDLITAVQFKVNELCLACLTGKYPTPFGQAAYDTQIAAKKTT